MKITAIKAKLKKYSRTNEKEHQRTLTRYFQERFLYRLSKSEYQKYFILKGGVLVYAIRKEMSRPTLDIDFLAQKMTADKDNIKSVFQEICQIKFNDGFIQKNAINETLDFEIVMLLITEKLKPIYEALK